MSNGGFLAHRNPKESEDELEIILSTCAGASGKAGQHHSNRILGKFIRPACAHGSSPLLHNMRPEERHKTVTGPPRGDHQFAGDHVIRALCRLALEAGARATQLKGPRDLDTDGANRRAAAAARRGSTSVFAAPLHRQTPEVGAECLTAHARTCPGGAG